MNEAHSYVAMVFYKANLCEQQKCLEATAAAEEIKKYSLPVVQKEITK
jgi:hypothetical protein